MARVEQIPRQWRIIRRLEAHRYGLSANDLADDEECPVRTIYRDLADLEEAGFPLIQERRGKRSVWKLAFNRKTPTVPFVFTELCALWVIRSFSELWRGSDIYDASKSAFGKVKAMLAPGVLEHLEDWDNKLFIRNREQVTGSFHETINKALVDSETLELEYQSPSQDSVTIRKVDPYRLWIQDHVMYLLAYCHLRKDMRTFHLARIQKATPTGEFFEENPDFDLEAHLSPTFRVMGGEVMKFEILFDAEVKHMPQESKWHPTQEIKPLEDGSGRVLLSFQSGGMEEVKSQVLSLGAKVEVLKPLALREEIIEELKQLQSRYK